MFLNLTILIIFIFILIFSISKWKVHPFIALILTSIGLGVSMGLGGQKTVEVLMKGFGETLGWIAVIIILGTFIGEVLQETGGVFRISGSIIKLTGEKKLPWAMGITGYLVSIPVFVDVAYILLHPVVDSLAVKSKKPVLYIGLSLAAGLTVSNALIPPTPGPMAMASLLHLNMGRMLLINLIVAGFAMTGGVLWVILFAKNSWLEYDKTLTESTNIDEDGRSVSFASGRGNVFFDVLPILVPIILIGTGTFIKFDKESIASGFLNFISTPLVAVLIGAFIAGLQLKERNKLNNLVEAAILKSAMVIMIIGAGGALGYVIRETSIQNEIVHIFSTYPFFGIMLPFIVASLLTISTGSITVSLVGTASMLGPMVHSLSVSPEMVGALIGCGSFCVLHANSSFFWLLNRLHEAPPGILYNTYTIQSLVIGLSGLTGVLLLKLIGF